MTERARITIELGSQDLSVEDMVKLRDLTIKGSSKKKGKGPQELIMFSAASKPYQYSSLDDFRNDVHTIPDDTSYFYYTITLLEGNRVSLYLDPDRPAKTVVEGTKKFIGEISGKVEAAFPKGGGRYKMQGSFGLFAIWGVVVSIALAVIVIYSLLSTPNPFLIFWVLFISSMLGIYLSVYNNQMLNPANTMALGKKRKKPWMDLILHLITITLGIISVVLVIVIFEYYM